VRSLRLTVFLWILLVLNAISALPVIFQILGGNLDLTDFFITLPIGIMAFSIYAIIMMFQLKAWARNFYLIMTAFSCVRLLLGGDIIPLIIVIVIHVFVFYKTWDEFY